MLIREQGKAEQRTLMAKAIEYAAKYEYYLVECGAYDTNTHCAAQVSSVMRELIVTELQYMSLPEYEAAIEQGVSEYKIAEEDLI